MSFYRSMIVAVAAMGLATAVFAADENSATAQKPAADAAPQAMQSADASAQQAAPQAMQTADASNTQAAQPAAADQAKVDLNKATAKDLMKVKGLTASKAKAIVAYRKKHGDFKTLDDLKDVKGFKKMKDDTMKQIQDQLTIG